MSTLVTGGLGGVAPPGPPAPPAPGQTVAIRYTGTFPIEVTFPFTGKDMIVSPGDTITVDARDVAAWDASPRPWIRVS